MESETFANLKDVLNVSDKIDIRKSKMSILFPFWIKINRSFYASWIASQEQKNISNALEMEHDTIMNEANF